MARQRVDRKGVAQYERERIDQLERDRAELIEVLRPFARLDIAHLSKKSDHDPVFALNNTMMLLGDIRHARLLLARLDKGE